MDEPIESFLADVLALESENANAIREGVRVALADYEQSARYEAAAGNSTSVCELLTLS